MEWVGHSDLEMVRRYYRLRDEHAKESMRKFGTGTPEAVERPCTSQPSDFGEHLGNERRPVDRKRERRDSQPLARRAVANPGANLTAM